VKRRFPAALLCALILGVLLVTALLMGSLPVGQIFALLADRDANASSAAAEILFQIRLPRMAMALLIGAMLALGGAVSQAVFRNPLADPYIIGISAGAAAGAVLAFLLKLPDFYYGPFAFVTALGTAFLIFRLSASRGAHTTDTAALLITGVALSSFLSAFTSLGMYTAGEDSYRVMIWTMGYLGQASWRRVALLAAPLALSSAYFLYLRNDLDALLLGDEAAHSLGLRVGVLKKRLLLLVSCVTAFSVAFAGIIGFVGLIVPHGVRIASGGSHGRLLPLSAFAGAVFLLFSDTLARGLLAPVEIPIGVVTAFFGAPFFLYLAIRQRRGR